MAKYPAKDVASWLGNSVPVAMQHYAMATDESFQAAASIPTSGADTYDGGHIGGHIMGRQEHTLSRQDSQGEAESPLKYSAVQTADSSRQQAVGDEGLEPPTSTL